MVLIPTRRWCCPYITAPSGMYALVQDAGRDTDYNGRAVWPSGWHFASPFPCWQRKISHLVTKQSIVFDTPIRGCKTIDDVTVTIDICVVFRIMGDELRGEDPALVREFVHTLGPAELARQLKDAQDERVRALARSVKHTEVYSLRSRGSYSKTGLTRKLSRTARRRSSMGNMSDAKITERLDQVNEKAMRVTEDMNIKLNAQFNKYGVQIIDVAIQRVSLPVNFEKQMESRTTYIAEIEEQKQKQSKDMQTVRQREEIETLHQKYADEQALERENGKKMETDVIMKLKNVVAVTNKIICSIKEESRAKVLEVNSATSLEVQKLASETNQILDHWSAKSNSESEKIAAECDAYVWKKSSEAQLVEIQHAAKSKKIVAEAEGASSHALQLKRAYLLRKKQIAMYSALADNRNVVITGNNAGRGMLPDLVMSQKESKLLLNVSSEG